MCLVVNHELEKAGFLDRFLADPVDDLAFLLPLDFTALTFFNILVSSFCWPVKNFLIFSTSDGICF